MEVTEHVTIPSSPLFTSNYLVCNLATVTGGYSIVLYSILAFTVYICTSTEGLSLLVATYRFALLARRYAVEQNLTIQFSYISIYSQFTPLCSTQLPILSCRSTIWSYLVYIHTSLVEGLCSFLPVKLISWIMIYPTSCQHNLIH